MKNQNGTAQHKQWQLKQKSSSRALRLTADLQGISFWCCLLETPSAWSGSSAALFVFTVLRTEENSDRLAHRVSPAAWCCQRGGGLSLPMIQNQDPLFSCLERLTRTQASEHTAFHQKTGKGRAGMVKKKDVLYSAPCTVPWNGLVGAGSE